MYLKYFITILCVLMTLTSFRSFANEIDSCCSISKVEGDRV